MWKVVEAGGGTAGVNAGASGSHFSIVSFVRVCFRLGSDLDVKYGPVTQGLRKCSDIVQYGLKRISNACEWFQL